MANLITKKLTKLPIGTHVELTRGEGGEQHGVIKGIVTDNDFSQNVEITTEKGQQILLAYSLILGFQETKTLAEVLKELPSGTVVRFSFGPEDKTDPDTTGTIVENDGSSVEIETELGKTMVLGYGMFRSLLVRSTTQKSVLPKPGTPQPEPVSSVKDALYEQTPENILNASDGKIKETFDRLSREERQLLGRVYDSFKYGIRINSAEKKKGAANQARQLLFQEDDRGYYWSREAVLFCAYLMQRVGIFDSEVPLVGECFEEAAYSCFRKGEHDLAGVYAAVALLEKEPKATADMLIILAHSVIKTEDASALSVLAKRVPGTMEPELQKVIEAAFHAKGISISIKQDIPAALTMLAPLYPGKEMAQELVRWLPKEETVAVKAQAVEQEEPQERMVRGTISWLNWTEQTGVITGDDGQKYTFRYQDISDEKLQAKIREQLRGDMGGKVFAVKFLAAQDRARQIQPGDPNVDRARAIVADATREDRFEAAFGLCKEALSTPDIRRALGDMVKYAIALYTNKQQLSFVKEAMDLYEKHITFYPGNAFAVIDIAQCYSYLKKYPQMLEHGEKALSFPGLDVKQKIAVMANYLKMIRQYHEISGDKALLTRVLELIDDLKNSYSRDLSGDKKNMRQYASILLPYRIWAACELDMLQEAEADYARLPDDHNNKQMLDELIEKARARLAPKVEQVPEPEVQQQEQIEALVEEEVIAEEDDCGEGTEVEEEDIVPYEDHDGWDALGITKEDVIDYALGITGPDRIPAILAYLRAGASLNSEIGPVYRTVALAANDPMESPDYDITALVDALANSDTDYPQLNDCCMAAAFLRASFISGRGYDYSTKGLRDSIAISQQLPALRDAYDTLEQFRKAEGCAIDIYADYRNHGVKKLKEEQDALTRHAEALYNKFVLTPAREGTSFVRILKTKRIAFARDGYLATMLRRIADRDQVALDAERAHFVATYLNGSPQFSAKPISINVVDSMIMEWWDEAGKDMDEKKPNNKPQGDLRSNLRSNVSEILGVICQWYALCEQDADFSWRTEQGEATYQQLRPLLLEQLEQLCAECDAEMQSCPDRQLDTGLFLLASTARELSAHLDGSWRLDQAKYLYVDFLRSGQVMLDKDYMPELTSTFCVLPGFNILARIRRHVEGEKLSFQERIDQIFGMDKTRNDYGAAWRIVDYLQAMGQQDQITLPDEPERFITHTQMQIDIRYRSFIETYWLAMNYGQIIKSDAFCYTLEDTVRYWYAFCKESKDFGFFTNILLQAEEQIHASAQQYEEQLEEQLDALISSNQQYFDTNPDYAEAIRAQIGNQNFTVAEDWMARIRIGDISLDLQTPEALGYLESFWNSFVATYDRVADASRPLSALLGRRDVRNKDTKGAQQLIDNWLNNGNRSNAQRIGQLLDLLGWKNIHVSPYQFAAEPRGEFYEVRKEAVVAGLSTPLHPIAAFGSELDKKRMYVTCLYGTYDCDRLYEKMRALDVIDGCKVILLDYALGQADRRALARKLKQRESSLRNVDLIIDRVLITYLADHYNENLINRILMATAIPFTYCQPYVVESVHTMPPEIFIGRKDELMKIEQADGVNLIYGGRQLGKSALFKKALADIDGHQRQRAILVDIKDLDHAAAARKLSTKLIDLKITPDAQVTEDWDELCRNIELRLRDTEDEIPYLLLMLDEADTFIDNCANSNYRPLVALKDVQQSLPGRFKYVLAGLHNVIKFNRQVALGNNSVITHMPSLKITPFRTPEAQELLTYPLSYLGFSLPSKVTVSQILATCNYFPGLIQLYAKKLVESVRAADYAGYDIKKTPPYVVSDKHLRRVMSDKDFVDQIHEKFEITLTLDQDQGSCYYPLALLIGWMYYIAPSKNGYTAKDVLYHARDLAVQPLAALDEEKIDALLQELQDLNILRSVSNDSYLLASKNFRDLLGSDNEIFEKLTKVGGVTV